MIKQWSLDVRPPRNRKERAMDGETKGNATSCRTWISSKLGKERMKETFFHEATHVYCDFTGQVMTPEEETRFAWFMGISAKLFTEFSSSAKDHPCYDQDDLKQWKELHKEA